MIIKKALLFLILGLGILVNNFSENTEKRFYLYFGTMIDVYVGGAEYLDPYVSATIKIFQEKNFGMSTRPGFIIGSNPLVFILPATVDLRLFKKNNFIFFGSGVAGVKENDLDINPAVIGGIDIHLKPFYLTFGISIYKKGSGTDTNAFLAGNIDLKSF